MKVQCGTCGDINTAKINPKIGYVECGCGGLMWPICKKNYR